MLLISQLAGQHSGAVVSAAGSQPEGPWFKDFVVNMLNNTIRLPHRALWFLFCYFSYIYDGFGSHKC